MSIIKDYIKILINFIKKYIWIILILGIFLLTTYLLKVINCPVKFITGYPCPGCGMTRAGFQALQFNFVKAFKFNPLIFIFPFILWICIFNERPIINKIYRSKIFWIVALLIVLVTYILRLIFVYPNVPMDYYENNLIHIIIDLFNKIFAK